LRVKPASRSHWAGTCMIVALARRVAYPVAAIRMAMVSLRRNASGLWDGRRSICARVCRKACIVAGCAGLVGDERSEMAPQGKPFERSENMACSEPVAYRAPMSSIATCCSSAAGQVHHHKLKVCLVPRSSRNCPPSQTRRCRCYRITSLGSSQNALSAANCKKG
jgi:hypothetical protein